MIRYLGIILGVFFVVSGTQHLQADEGMWMPFLLKQGIIDTMQAKGLELDAEDIFSNDSVSLKDALAIVGGGCSGSIISPSGLVLTNHHCALSSLEKISAPNNNLVKDGFWSQSVQDERPVPGLSVKLLNDVINVTARFARLEKETFTEKERKHYIDSLSKTIAKEHPAGPNQHATVEGFYFDQQFYLFEYTVYEDVRLVAAPPLSIGKFGGDKDNWMWPRHTGDFAVFRVYASPGNEATAYHDENVPFSPGKHMPVSTAGVQESDFVWIYGFPGYTFEYLPSRRLDQIRQKILPNRIEIQEMKLQALEQENRARRPGNEGLMSRQARISNVLKKYKGMTEGLEKVQAVKAKEEMEQRLDAWADSKMADTSYKKLVHQVNEAYQQFYPVYMANDYASGVFLGTDLMRLTLRFYHENVKDTAYMNDLRKFVNPFVESGDIEIQKDLSKKLLKAYYRNIDKEFYPDHFAEVETTFEGDIHRYVDHVFEKSLFSSEKELGRLMNMWTWRIKRKLQKDPLYQLTYDMGRTYWGKIRPLYDAYEHVTDSLQRAYFNLQRKAFPDKIFYPDANRTCRVAYGHVKGYSPGDAVYYNWHTSVSGIVYKWQEGDKAYEKDQKLQQLIKNEDYGTYFSHKTPVCFISNIHTTGGNSGSPVLNGKGELVGLNFDRNWEGTMADYYYDPSVCRNIMVDIRYILFLLEKYGASQYVLDELTIR